MTSAPIVALEIGTAKVCALVGEARDDGNIMVTGIGQCPACGVRKGVIVDLEKAVACGRAAIQGAEQSSNVAIREICLLVSGGHVQSVVNPGSVPVADPRRGVTGEDLEQVQDIARAIHLPHDRRILHSVSQFFAVDGQGGVLNPEGMPGAKLSLDMLIVHCDRKPLDNLIQAAQNLGLEVADMAFSGLAAAMAVLTPEQKQCGVALIDLGAGATSVVVYAGGVTAAAGALAVGGDHVTNDIAQGFSISLPRAEILKLEAGAALPDSGSHFQSINLPPEVGFAACSLAASDLAAVIHARVDELFRLIRHDLEDKQLLARLGAGIVLTGGGARLRGVTTLAERVFEMPCVLGCPRNFSGLSTAQEGPEYAALLGLLRFAVRSGGPVEETISLGALFRRWLGRG